MSQAKTPSYTCGYCNENHTKAETIEGSYCSRECYFEHQGEKILNLITHDHRFCASCFRQIKEVEKPTQTQLHDISGFESTQSVIGYQYLTQHADKGEKQLHTKPDIIDTTTICECGSHHSDSFLRDLEFTETVKRFVRAFVFLKHEGQHEKGLDVEVLCTNLKNEKDWAYSIGEAIA